MRIANVERTAKNGEHVPSAGVTAGVSRPCRATPATVIVPPAGWSALDLRELWRFRELVATLAIRDVKLRYKQTVLGILWVVLQPLAAALIFAFLFGRVAGFSSAGVPYVVFALAGLVGWQLFHTALTQASNCLLANAQLVSKIWFHRLALPLSTVPAALLDFLVASAVLALLLLVNGIGVPAAVLLLPAWIALLLALALGLGLFAGALAVRYRDVQRILPVATQLLLYASPVAYTAATVQERVSADVFRVYMLNPLAGLLEALRWSLLGIAPTSWSVVAYAGATSVAVLVAGALFFQNRERSFADVI